MKILGLSGKQWMAVLTVALSATFVLWATVHVVGPDVTPPDDRVELTILSGDPPPGMQLFTAEVEGYGVCTFVFQRGHIDSLTLVGCGGDNLEGHHEP